MSWESVEEEDLGKLRDHQTAPEMTGCYEMVSDGQPPVGLVNLSLSWQVPFPPGTSAMCGTLSSSWGGRKIPSSSASWSHGILSVSF